MGPFRSLSKSKNDRIFDTFLVLTFAKHPRQKIECPARVAIVAENNRSPWWLPLFPTYGWGLMESLCNAADQNFRLSLKNTRIQSFYMAHQWNSFKVAQSMLWFWRNSTNGSFKRFSIVHLFIWLIRDAPLRHSIFLINGEVSTTVFSTADPWLCCKTRIIRNGPPVILEHF